MEPSVATNVHLTPELESFARACVEGGLYNNVSEVVRSGLRLLKEREDRRRDVRRDDRPDAGGNRHQGRALNG